jgi:hypothetical protein
MTALQTRIFNTRLVLRAVERGWLRFPEPESIQAQRQQTLKARRARTRLLQARLRAERRGEDTSGFPARVRRRYQRRNRQ